MMLNFPVQQYSGYNKKGIIT